MVRKNKKTSAYIGPFTELEKCLDEARSMFRGDYEESEYDQDEQDAVVCDLTSTVERLQIRVFKLTDPPKRTKKRAVEDNGAKCGYVFSKGKYKSQKCLKKCVADFSLCPKHGGKPEVTTGCEHINKSGDRCGKPIVAAELCKKHQPEVPALAPAPLPTLVTPAPLAALTTSPPVFTPQDSQQTQLSPGIQVHISTEVPAPRTSPLKKRKSKKQPPVTDLLDCKDGFQHPHDIIDIKLDFNNSNSEVADEQFECPISDDCSVYMDNADGNLTFQNPADTLLYDPVLIMMAVDKALEFLKSTRTVKAITYNGERIDVTTSE